MKGISSQGERAGEHAGDEFEQEEGRVDGDHDLDPGALGPGHFLQNAHGDGLGGARAGATKDGSDRLESDAMGSKLAEGEGC